MKLQMKNQLTFQEKSGYPDDPCPVTEGDVKEQLMYWHDLLVKADEERPLDPDLMNLEAFLYNLASGEVEYTDPANEYEYTAIFEYSKGFNVHAYSQEEADKIAKQRFYEFATWVPVTIGQPTTYLGCAKVDYQALERDSDARRIAEQL